MAWPLLFSSQSDRLYDWPPQCEVGLCFLLCGYSNLNHSHTQNEWKDCPFGLQFCQYIYIYIYIVLSFSHNLSNILIFFYFILTKDILENISSSFSVLHPFWHFLLSKNTLHHGICLSSEMHCRYINTLCINPWRHLFLRSYSLYLLQPSLCVHWRNNLLQSLYLLLCSSECHTPHCNKNCGLAS